MVRELGILDVQLQMRQLYKIPSGFTTESDPLFTGISL